MHRLYSLNIHTILELIVMIHDNLCSIVFVKWWNKSISNNDNVCVLARFAWFYEIVVTICQISQVMSNADFLNSVNIQATWYFSTHIFVLYKEFNKF